MGGSFHQNNVNLSYFLLLAYILVVSNNTVCILFVKIKKVSSHVNISIDILILKQFMNILKLHGAGLAIMSF